MKRAGRLVVNKDDALLFDLAEKSGTSFVSYGVESESDFKAENLKNEGDGYSFFVKSGGIALAYIKLSVLGNFSVYNALAAFALCYLQGIPAELIAKSLSEFNGIERRLELVGKRNNAAPIVYDYAHHPTEIREGILALRENYKGKINVIFKPHTYTRTRDLFDEFVLALSLADRILISEIDAIRENKIEGVSAEKLAAAIGAEAKALSDSEILKEIKTLEGAIIIMGAANLEALKTEISQNKY
jgi:UDP-N-acetylmuramate--alanine ligase